MTLKDLRIGWRTLAADPAYSLVVIGALAVGLAACLLLLGFVRFSWTYNTHVPDVERVYVVKMRYNVNPDSPWFDQAPLLLRHAAAKTPGVEAVTAWLATRPMRSTARIDGVLRHVDCMTVLPGFADILGLRTLRGDLKSALELPDAVALTDAMAISLFGTDQVLDRRITLEGRSLRVLAVVSAPPANTTVPFETLVGVNSSLVEPIVREEMLSGSQGWWAKMLIRVRDDASPGAIQTALQAATDAMPFNQNLTPDMKARLGKTKPMDIALKPLRYAYFDREIAPHFVFGTGERASPAVIAGLAVVAVLVLLLAAINYVNLATVRVLRRQREIALRKVLGGGTRRIALQFLAESLLVALAATALGLLLAKSVEPLFAELVARRLEPVLAPVNLVTALVLGLSLGVASAVYPAYVALRVRPALALSGRPDSESARGMQVRRVLTVAQVAVGMCLAGVTLAVGWQSVYAMRASPGFDAAPLLVVDIPEIVDFDPRPAVRQLAAALRAQPAVAGVTIQNDAVGRRQTFQRREMYRPGGAAVDVALKPVGNDFFDVYRVKPQLGRLFSPSMDQQDGADTMVINAIAARQLGFPNPQAALGQIVQFRDWERKVRARRIVGIAPEIRFRSLHTAPEPVAYEVTSEGLVLTVRAMGSVHDTQRAIRSLWPSYFPDRILTVHRAGDVLAANYAEEARMARLLAIASAIALAIAAFGAYALAAHTVQRRAREIVLRKLYGAGPRDIRRMVAREIGLLCGVAALIALPVGALLIHLYLAGYVEHARPSGYWALLPALLCTLLVVTVAVARQAIAAMRMRPDAVLRA